MALEPLAWHPHATTDDRLAMAALEAAQTTASMGSTMATPMHRGNRKTQRHAHLFFARELQTGSTRQRTKAVGEQCPRTPRAARRAGRRASGLTSRSRRPWAAPSEP